MAESRKNSLVARALVQLEPVKGEFLRASLAAATGVRSCEGCDAHCCREGFNSMLVSRIEAVALRRRLLKRDLAPLVPEILKRARQVVAERGLEENAEATYDCPLLSSEGRCIVHGSAQPAGCHTFQPVDDGGCDHDFRFFRKNVRRIESAERRAFGKLSSPLPIPVALLRVFRTPAEKT